MVNLTLTLFLKVIQNVKSNGQWHCVYKFSITSLYLNGYWDMANSENFQGQNWPYFSRSSKMLKVMHSDVMSIGYKSQVHEEFVSLTVTEIWQIENFQVNLTLTQFIKVIQNVTSNVQWHHVFNHRSVSLTITEIWQIEFFQGQFDLDLISQGHPKCEI